MSSRKIGALIFGLALLVVIGFTIYRILVGKVVGFNEIGTISVLAMSFLSAITWGSEREKDGILQNEELGQKITEKSSKISYFILVGLILVAVFLDQLVNETVNIFLLIILGLSMVTLPLVEYIVAKRYQ